MKTIKATTIAGHVRTIKVPTRKNPLTVFISRRRWLRGRGACNATLHHPVTHKQCCLGFDARALGFKLEDIKDIGAPHCIGLQTPCPVPGLATPDGDDHKPTTICQQMMSINDAAEMPDAERESKLKVLAKKIHRIFIFKP